MKPKYLPIDPDFFDMFDKEKENDSTRVVYFDEGTNLVDNNENGFFILFENGNEVRVDRIIVYNGKPGPAFDEYDAYANECLSCRAGYEL